jgi:PAS domain S-box-containing protein
VSQDPKSPPLPPDQYRLLVESSPVMIWRSRLDGKCDYFNETWLRFRGRTLDQEMGDGWAEGVHPDDLAHCLEVYLGHFGRREPFSMEYRLQRHDGVFHWIHDSGVPFADDAGRFLGFIGSCIDVNERHEADRARGSFLGAVAEELALPVRGLSVLASWLRRDINSGTQVEEQLVERLVQRVQHLDGLVAEFSDAARYEQGAPPVVQRRQEDLAPLVRKIVQAHAQVLLLSREEPMKHALRLSVEPGEHRALVDPHSVDLMLSHLLVNATIYAPGGGPIDVLLGSRDGEVSLTVSDTGIGIPPAEISDVKRRYYRASNAPAPEFAGLGLGLAIVDELCRAHDGRLEIASTLGVGTGVTIRLPSIHA